MKQVRNILFLFLLILLLGACSRDQSRAIGEEGYRLYYINSEGNRIISENADLSSGDHDHLQQLLSKLLERSVGENESYLLPDGVELLNYEVDGQQLKLNFNAAYQGIPKSREVLARACLVRTCVQLPEISSVAVYVEDEPLRDSRGNDIGSMDEKSFVENSGSEINAYALARMTLYFSNDRGDKLVQEARTSYYSTSMPMERVVVEQLLSGPREGGHFAAIPSDTKILGVAVADNVCYVNLSSEFSDFSMNLREEIPIYSITNSLVASCNVSYVQISINGDTKRMYRDRISLDQFLEKREDLLEEESM